MQKPSPHETSGLPTGEPWDSGSKVADVLLDAGFETYAAGGCVRDLLLGLPVHDIDLATAAHPEQVEAAFQSVGWRTIAVGKAFGVVVVVTPSGVNIEVATFRSDGAYIDGRRPTSVSFSTARDDVERRDFTINALLLDLRSGTVIDHVHGRADLAVGLIRAVGDAAARLQEDRLRVLRALRFAAHRAFQIEPATWEALRSTSLTGLSAERVVQEWFKGLAGPHAGRWLQLLSDSGQLSAFCPPLSACSDAERAALVERFDRLQAGEDKSVAATVWLSGSVPEHVEHWLVQQPLPAHLVKSVRWLLTHGRDPAGLLALPQAGRRRIWQHPDAERLGRVLRCWHGDTPAVAKLEQELASETAAGPWCLLVRADDLIAAGTPPGPGLGALLRHLEDAQLEGRFTTRDEGLALARQWALRAEKPQQP